jgi:hypothetical protein
MSVALDADTVHAQFHTDLVINGIKKCLENGDVPVEIRSNTCTFASNLLNSKPEEFRQMLNDMEFGAAIDSAAEKEMTGEKEFEALREKLKPN